MWVILTLIVLIAGTIVCGKKIKSTFKYKDREDTLLGMYAILFIIYFLFVPILIVKIQDVITSLTFPEKTILDFIITYTQNQLKGNN